MSPKVKKLAMYYAVAGVAFAGWQAYKVGPMARSPVTFAENAALWPVKLFKSF